MRTVYHQQLDSLTAGIAELCGLAGQAMQCATRRCCRATSSGPNRSSPTMIGSWRARGVWKRPLSPVALKAPVAGELRASARRN